MVTLLLVYDGSAWREAADGPGGASTWQWPLVARRLSPLLGGNGFCGAASELPEIPACAGASSGCGRTRLVHPRNTRLWLKGCYGVAQV